MTDKQWQQDDEYSFLGDPANFGSHQRRRRKKQQAKELWNYEDKCDRKASIKYKKIEGGADIVPAKVVQIAWSYRRQSCATPEFFVRELSVVFELLASSLNFLIYCVFLRRFRRRFVLCARRTHLAAGRELRERREDEHDADDAEELNEHLTRDDINSPSFTARARI